MARFPVVEVAEVLSMLIRAAFDFARKAGMSQEEVNKAYEIEYAKFEQNDPAKLPDV